jgi:hypothetical protein
VSVASLFPHVGGAVKASDSFWPERRSICQSMNTSASNGRRYRIVMVIVGCPRRACTTGIGTPEAASQEAKV